MAKHRAKSHSGLWEHGLIQGLLVLQNRWYGFIRPSIRKTITTKKITWQKYWRS